jgi:ATP-dependent Clp protease ATP-binding subunit ClpA
MFERFTTDARDIVTQAHTEARRRRDHAIGTQHLLLAMARADGPTRSILESFGLAADAIDDRLDCLVGSLEQPLDANDARALAELGIDLDRVRDTVEQTFGEGALSRAALETAPDRRRSRWGHVLRRGRPSRRTRGRHAASVGHRAAVHGHLPFNPRSKKALELSLREAIRLKQKHIAAEHVALGILREGGGLACQAIGSLGVDAAELRQALEARALAG